MINSYLFIYLGITKRIMNTYSPDWISPPGDTIKDLLEEKGYELNKIAHDLNLTFEDMNKLIKGRLHIDELLGNKLAIYLGSTKQFWMCREKNYREQSITYDY